MSAVGQSVYSIRRPKGKGCGIDFLNSNYSSVAEVSSQDFSAVVSWNEVKKLARRINCEFDRGKGNIYPNDLESYNRLLMFSALRQSIEKESSSLLEVVLNLNGYDLSYWAIYFKRAFWRGDIERVKRISNAFMLFFALV